MPNDSRKPDFHMTEDEQVEAMRTILGLILAGEQMFNRESSYEDILEIFGEDSIALAEAVSEAHHFLTRFYLSRGLPMPIPMPEPRRSVHPGREGGLIQ